ncbi:MAG: aldo/keto reductase [Candidatus Zixiibacteriota bacterium]|nr:MAG: aldo/keto reductase [candidate division Zixibacteria bacterium]
MDNTTVAAPELTLASRVRLNNGLEMPYLGLGVYLIPEGPPAVRAVRWALEAGYRLIDTASAYGNERSVGQAIRESGIPRSEVFVTTKLATTEQGYESALKAFSASLNRLGLDYVDLYLIHWPVTARRVDSWKALETLAQDSRCLAIGVSNYMIRHLQEVFDCCATVPAVNQIELSPYIYGMHSGLVDFCRQQGIVLEAYSPLAKARKLNDPRLVQIAEQHGKTTAQVLIRWALQHDFVVIPKSADRGRIRENAAVFDFSLSPEDMARLDAFNLSLATGWDPRGVP